MKRSFAALVVVGAALCAAAALVTVTGTATGHVWLEGWRAPLSVAAPIGVGLYALRRPPFQRFGALLLCTGAVWFLTTLTNADDSVVYSSAGSRHGSSSRCCCTCCWSSPTAGFRDASTARWSHSWPC